ncbi:MAG: AMP-binding protein [Phycisphaera sp.]|nr:AMP-binding protein [Phycisphaera sp.]
MSALWPLVRQCLATASRTAVVDDRGETSYGKLLGGAMFIADLIDSRTDRAHVGVMLPTSGAFPMALMGAWLAKRTAVPFNYLLSPDELLYVIRDSDVGIILTSRLLIEHLPKKVVDELPAGVTLVYLDGLDAHGLPPLRWPPAASPNDNAAILYTSGTSGKPKGVVLTHGNLRSNVHAAIEHAQLTQADVFLGVLPQFHSFGLTALTLLPLYVGAKVVYSARFVPRKIVELIREHRPDVMMAVPSMYGALLTVKNAVPEDFASLRFAVSGGEPLPSATYEACMEKLGLNLLEGYGLTETSPVCNWCTPTRKKPHSVGTALPGVHEYILDEEGHDLGRNADGEIVIDGPNIMIGYYKLPEQTAGVFMEATLKDGQKRRVFRTGDIGHIDDRGYLYITGRKKEMLIIGGENVFPREIEEVLNQHTSVKDSAVIGQQDPLRGETPVAFIEVNEGCDFNEVELRDWCRERLAQFKVPREIRRVDALPRNPTGKVLRRQLKAE